MKAVVIFIALAVLIALVGAVMQVRDDQRRKRQLVRHPSNP